MGLTKFSGTFPQKPNTTGETRQEVDATPTADGMQINVSRPVTHETAPHDQYSHEFVAGRVALALGAPFTAVVPNIPKYWAVLVNADSGAGALVQVISGGGMDVTLGVGQHIVFPARSNTLTVITTVAAANVTIFNLGDDELQI